MQVTIKAYYHDTPEYERFVSEIPVEMNIPAPHKNISDHLDLQIGQVSLHIPINALRHLVDNALFIRGIMSNPNDISMKISENNDNVIKLREKI